MSKAAKHLQAKADDTTLDAAVSELAKQTEALLGKPSQPKPRLAKRTTTARSKTKTKAKSFDIVHPKTKTRLKPILKASAAPPAKAPPAAPAANQPEPKLLAEASTANVPADATQPTPGPGKIIKPHQSGSLQVQPDQSEVRAQAKTVTSEVTASPRQASSQNPLQFDETSLAAESDDTNKPATAPTKSAEPETTQTEAAEPTAVGTEPKPHAHGAVYANNLRPTNQPKSYQTTEKSQKPTVFDTNEYHPALHDWSKLRRQRRWPWLVLVLLLALVAGSFILFGEAAVSQL